MNYPYLFIIMMLFTTLPKINANIRTKRAAEIHSCSNKIYCQGSLLDTVQKLQVFEDSKTFVDMVQRNDEKITLQKFDALMSSTSNKPTKNDVANFVNENFVLDEYETEVWTPPDFTENPQFLYRINDDTVQSFATKLVSRWPKLGRRIKYNVKQNPTRHSILPLPKGFIIPGGRFREIYYWDSYWIIKGLLISEMYETVKGILDNFIYLIKTYGFVPNGSRIYYINRSQPPLFTAMVGLYIDNTDDLEWLRSNIGYIEKELVWWLDHRTVTITKDGKTYQLAHYGPESNTPRPESYSEDISTCSIFKNEDEMRTCYNNLKSGAETGWDFSTRWIFDAEGSTKASLAQVDPKRVIPVDLNSYLCKSFRLLSEFHEKLGNYNKQNTWRDHANKWQKNIEKLLYNATDGIWYDLDRTLIKQRNVFFASNFAPLWAECYDLEKKEEYGQRAADYFKDQKLDAFVGGIPTSLESSGEQWDLPNVWPPLQDIVVTGLYKTNNELAKSIARTFAKRSIQAFMTGFEKSGYMYEKYDAFESGMYGYGGEYKVQLGFGWSNGVALSFIEQFNSARMLQVILNPFTHIVVLGIFIFFR